MNLGVNYSPPAVELLQQGRIRFDRIKCPAWPDLVQGAQAVHPVYIHFPLKIGWGRGTALDNESGEAVRWQKIERFMDQTDTPLVNLHFSPFHQGAYAFPEGISENDKIDLVAERAIRDVSAVVERFGAERVIVENESPTLENALLKAVYLPETIRQVVLDSGCGLLLDVSHARLAAEMLGMDPQEYIQALPVELTREIHITGIQVFDQSWIDRLQKDSGGPLWISRLPGRRMDHLPMTEEDWQFTTWAMEQVHHGKWGNPWVVTFEYGGVGAFWGDVTLPSVLAGQVPRLWSLVHNSSG